MRDPVIGVGFETLIPDVGEPRLGEFTFSFVSHRTFEVVLGDALLILWYSVLETNPVDLMITRQLPRAPNPHLNCEPTEGAMLRTPQRDMPDSPCPHFTSEACD